MLSLVHDKEHNEPLTYRFEPRDTGGERELERDGERKKEKENSRDILSCVSSSMPICRLFVYSTVREAYTV